MLIRLRLKIETKMKIVKNKRVSCYGIVYHDKNQVLLVRKAGGVLKWKNCHH